MTTKKAAAARRPIASTNESAVQALLDGLDADPALARLAITLAKSLDEGVGMATAAVARELRATLAEIREGAAATDVQTTKADELRARRATRLAAASDL
jgi:hypothetical protein